MDKKVLVAGAGKSGVAASKLLARNGREVILYDENMKGELTRDIVLDKFSDAPFKENIDTILGTITDEQISACDYMVISPGIPTDNGFAKRVKSLGVRVLSEIELAYMYEQGTVIAITGTNGKTTTTTLVGEIMKAYNDETFVVGNIGIPYTDLADKTKESSVTVAEISSFQLETVETFKPHISACLNITPDHLDRHHTFDNYAACKMAIAKKQTMEDYMVLNYDDPETLKRADLDNVNVVFFSRLTHLDEGVYVDVDDVVIKKDNVITKILSLKDINLLGTHNVENILAAVAITYYAGVPVATIRKVCTEFKGVAHRIEYVRTVNGVKYYNDSKGTNPDAAIKGIKAMTTTTFLIGGGYDKDSTYDEWVDTFFGRVKLLILMGETAEKIEECCRRKGFDREKIVHAGSIEEAVDIACENAVSGDAVLLSPACASWDMFKDYEERGNRFKEHAKSKVL